LYTKTKYDDVKKAHSTQHFAFAICNSQTLAESVGNDRRICRSRSQPVPITQQVPVNQFSPY